MFIKIRLYYYNGMLSNSGKSFMRVRLKAHIDHRLRIRGTDDSPAIIKGHPDPVNGEQLGPRNFLKLFTDICNNLFFLIFLTFNTHVRSAETLRENTNQLL